MKLKSFHWTRRTVVFALIGLAVLLALAVNIIFLFRNQNWFETMGIAIAIALATLVSTISTVIFSIFPRCRNCYICCF